MDQVIRQCVPEDEMGSILTLCHPYHVGDSWCMEGVPESKKVVNLNLLLS